MITIRARKLAKSINTVIATILNSDLHDSRLNWVTVTYTKVTPDLKTALVYYTVAVQPSLESFDSIEIQKSLEKTVGLLRTKIGQMLVLKYVPKIIFKYDEIPAHTAVIDELLLEAKTRDLETSILAEKAKYIGLTNPYKSDVNR